MTTPEPTVEKRGFFGYRIWWPAGLAELSPAERAAALERGWWRDGDRIVHRDGRIEQA